MFSSVYAGRPAAAPAAKAAASSASNAGGGPTWSAAGSSVSGVDVTAASFSRGGDHGLIRSHQAPARDVNRGSVAVGVLGVLAVEDEAGGLLDAAGGKVTGYGR